MKYCITVLSEIIGLCISLGQNSRNQCPHTTKIQTCPRVGQHLQQQLERLFFHLAIVYFHYNFASARICVTNIDMPTFTRQQLLHQLGDGSDILRKPSNRLVECLAHSCEDNTWTKTRNEQILYRTHQNHTWVTFIKWWSTWRSKQGYTLGKYASNINITGLPLLLCQEGYITHLTVPKSTKYHRSSLGQISVNFVDSSLMWNSTSRCSESR